MSDILETMDRIDEHILEIEELNLKLHYENMYLNYLCNKISDAIPEGMLNVRLEFGE